MTAFLSEILSPIAYEGPDSKNPLAFKYYDSEKMVAGRTMADHLRFAGAYWHTFKGRGELNFDAKLRRGSTDSLDLFYAHIGGMDTFARGLTTAQKIIDDGLVEKFISERYAGYDSDLGKRIRQSS